MNTKLARSQAGVRPKDREACAMIFSDDCARELNLSALDDEEPEPFLAVTCLGLGLHDPQVAQASTCFLSADEHTAMLVTHNRACVER